MSRAACGLRDVSYRRANAAAYGHDDWEPHMVCCHVDRCVSVGSGECGRVESGVWGWCTCSLFESTQRRERMSTDCGHAISHVLASARSRSALLGCCSDRAREGGKQLVVTRLAFSHLERWLCHDPDVFPQAHSRTLPAAVAVVRVIDRQRPSPSRRLCPTRGHATKRCQAYRPS